MEFPFLTDAFLNALQDTGAATPSRGWGPCHLRDGDALMPIYARDGSRGEYVFDFAWADAYQRNGLAYYPKLVTAIPFTPVVGPRWRGDWRPQQLWEGVRERIAQFVGVVVGAELRHLRAVGPAIAAVDWAAVAARAVAGFMARQLGEPVGRTVGYRTRLDTRVSAATRIEVVTEGVLTRMLSNDPALEGYAAVLFDEFHERSLQADLGLALVQEVRQALREDLRLLVMSATLDVGPLAEGLALPTVRSEGRVFPVEVSHAPPGRDQDVWDHCARQVEALAGEGTVLVFLPGVGEIERLRERLSVSMPVQVLHGRLAGDAQAAVLEAPSGPRVVLATNVAETSVTIEGVTVVVDSGLERRPSYDPRRHRSRLVTRRISQANADQRAGRAGRLGPGRCVRLWAREEVLARHIEPEIHQTGLESLVLDLARWGCRDPDQLFWLDPPPAG
ncbi:peptidogalycan biosysnthesis protein, partial [Alloalcanivorax venustensis]|uniref:peptidogalycan biosysnthesis protein n=1 Tax=Alloalcanivorax venustensis TaxID=172371 RepID=UPI003C475D58